MGNGIADELSGINLGDARLNQRSVKMIEKMNANTQASINGSFHTWAETQAAYRFLDNPSVTPEKILTPHIEATKKRIAQQPVVLVLQDTTELDYTKHPPRDAKRLDHEHRSGIYDHTNLAITPEGLPLGVVGQELFDREPEPVEDPKARQKLPIEEKESYRWIKGYRLACELAKENPDTQIVSVADREADIYDMYVEHQQDPTAADFVIRAQSQKQRSTPDPDHDKGENAYVKVFDVVKRSEVRTRMTIDLPRTPKREARTALLEIRAKQVTIRAPHVRRRLPEVTVNVIDVQEVSPPDDGTEVSWTLYTSLPIKTVADLNCVLGYYTARWGIEVYFRTLKSGCTVEELRLETTARLKNCLAFYKIIAWRVLQLTHLHRECPTLPVTSVFSEPEYKSVWRIVKREDAPDDPPTLAEFVPLLASLGGYNCRAGESPPGAEVLWLSIRRMTDFALAWLAFGPE